MAKESSHAIDIHVGHRLRAARMARGISQEKMGELLGITFQQIQKYEKGANRISASRLYDISLVLGVGIQYFFDDIPPEISGIGGGRPEAQDSAQPYKIQHALSSDAYEMGAQFARIGEARIRKALFGLTKVLSKDETTETSHEP